jgi:ATP-dependent Clp protease ATP-binding subunit ClpC
MRCTVIASGPADLKGAQGMVAGFSDRIQVNFTGRARRVMVRAKEEARMLGHTWVGTEHLLLGLIGEEGGAAEVLKSLSISLEAARQQVEDIIGWGHEVPSGPAWFTPRAQRILHLAQQEALAFQDCTSTEHILVGLTYEADGVAAQVLVTLGADLNRIRQLARGRTGASPVEG